MKKLLAAISIPIILSVFLLTSCADNVVEKNLAKPDDTTLEFWITQKVSEDDFRNHYQVYDVFGAYEYYGYGYQPINIADNHFGTPPEHCVIYTVSGYPDASDDFTHITRIDITDPTISIYGITCDSTFDEFDKTFTELGCDIDVTFNGYAHTAKYGKTRIDLKKFSDMQSLVISVNVTNKYGIVF